MVWTTASIRNQGPLAHSDAGSPALARLNTVPGLWWAGVYRWKQPLTSSSCYHVAKSPAVADRVGEGRK